MSPVTIATGDVQVLKGKGFPKSPRSSPDDPESYGDLYIQFRVENVRQEEPLTLEERQQLRYLLEKLQGKKPEKSRGRKSRKGNHKNFADEKSADEHSGVHMKEKNEKPNPSIHRLIQGNLADFGRATGIACIQRDEHTPSSDDDYYFENRGGFPFGMGASTFFQSSQNGDGRTRSFYFGSGSSHPFFGGGSPSGDDDAHTQCQQM